MNPNIGISDGDRKKIVAILNTLLADEYVLGRLAPIERAAFSVHTASCAECHRELSLAKAFALSLSGALKQNETGTKGMSKAFYLS